MGMIKLAIGKYTARNYLFDVGILSSQHYSRIVIWKRLVQS